MVGAMSYPFISLECLLFQLEVIKSDCVTYNPMDTVRRSMLVLFAIPTLEAAETASGGDYV